MKFREPETAKFKCLVLKFRTPRYRMLNEVAERIEQTQKAVLEAHAAKAAEEAKRMEEMGILSTALGPRRLSMH
eukprot:13853828-Alexandrium_andersonii.AAC.1